MSFFDRLGSASKDAVRKTKELADITKLNFQISNEEDRIKSKYIEIGKLYFELFSAAPDEKFADFCTAIVSSQGKIADLKDQIQEIKGVKKCSKCGAEIAYTATFCSSCGSPNDQAKTEEAATPEAKAAETEATAPEATVAEAEATAPIETVAPVEDEDDFTCPSCGNSVPVDTVFCPNCGSKLN